MSLDYAILGFLNSMPLSGYDLKKHFDNTVQHFWSADQSQIYRVLARLDEKGLITQEVIEQDDRPNRKVYHLTDKGREELATWLKSPVAFPPKRQGPMIQVFFGGQLTDEELLEVFERQAHVLRKKLERLQEIPVEIGRDEELFPTERDYYMSMLTLEAGTRLAETRLAFAEEVIERLKNGEFPQQ